jgi:hypothetical protein
MSHPKAYLTRLAPRLRNLTGVSQTASYNAESKLSKLRSEAPIRSGLTGVTV